MIRLDGVTKRYPGGNEALRDVSLEIEAGEFVFLTGHSGAGKSTLLRLIALLERSTQGRILVESRLLERMRPREVPHYRRRIGMIFQEHHLLPDRSAFDNVALPLLVCGLADGEIHKRVRAALDKVNLLHRAGSPVITLSRGEQQRIGIARAVVNRPMMVLADEPTGNLDPALSSEILRLFEQFNQVGVTVVIATHDMALLDQRPSRVVQLERGLIVADSGS